MIDNQKLEKIKHEQRKRKVEKIKMEKQMEIDALHTQLEKMQNEINDLKEQLRAKDAELKEAKKSKK